jgi:ParB family transcriptional regulator, chromosome partitioning protein
MTKLPEGKTRLDLVREGLGDDAGLKKRGRLVVRIDRLQEDARNERRTFRNMEGLIASIQRVGLVEPITVTPEADGQTYRIITGHRRFRAAKQAGLDQVEVLIREPEDEINRRLKSIVSNVQREDVGPVEMAEALQSLLDEHEGIRTQEDLSKMIGKDKAWVSGMLRILTLPVALQQQVGSTQLSVPYDTMTRIARLDNPVEQGRLVDAVLAGATQRDIRAEIDRLKGKGRANAKGEHAPLKPKRVYRTPHRAMVIVQATGRELANEQCIDALREALAQAAGG